MPAVGAMRVEIRHKAFAETHILDWIDFTVEPGTIAVLTGPSGIGKTTLLRIIAGLDENFEGTVAHSGPVAMVFQSPTLLPWRTALENLTLITGIDRAGALRLLDEVGLEGKAGLFPGQLSLGQQRRLSLARALSAEPTCLLMDEPFISLDEETADRMRRLTLRVLENRGIATLIVTHDLVEAATFADRVMQLGGPPATIETVVPIGTNRSNRNVSEEAENIRKLLMGHKHPHHDKLT